MLEAKAATVTAALINQGYEVHAYVDANGAWHVAANGPAINPQAVATFATNNTVTATVTAADFV